MFYLMIVLVDENPSKFRCERCFQLLSKNTRISKHYETEQCKRKHQNPYLVVKRSKIDTANDDEIEV